MRKIISSIFQVALFAAISYGVMKGLAFILTVAIILDQ